VRGQGPESDPLPQDLPLPDERSVPDDLPLPDAPPPDGDRASAGAAPADGDAPFWKRKSLAEMTPAEWESLCDGCGRCCLNKLEDVDTGAIAWTDVACRLLDGVSCRCSDYDNRFATVPDCVRLTPAVVEEIAWLPPSCAYRLVDEGRDLPWWHPLVSGDPDTVHAARVSVRRRTVSELVVPAEEFEERLRMWPGQYPRAGISPRRPPPRAKAAVGGKGTKAGK